MTERGRLKNQSLRKVVSEILPSRYTESKNFLQDLYLSLKRDLERYSYIEMASDLGFSATNVLFLIIQGKRPLSLKAAKKIQQALELHGAEGRYFLALVAYENAKTPQQREDLFRQLIELKEQTNLSQMARAQLRFFTEWFHPVVRELVSAKEFKSDPEWIANHIRPRIRPRQAADSLALLEELGMIAFDEEKGRHLLTQKNLTTGDEIASISVVRYHQQILDLAKDALTDISEMERDISSVIMPANQELAETVKKEVQAFRKRMLALCDQCADPEMVMQLNIQLVPVTRNWRRKS